MVLVFLIAVYQRDHGMLNCLTFLADLLFSTDVKVYVGSYILDLVDLTECLQS